MGEEAFSKIGYAVMVVTVVAIALAALAVLGPEIVTQFARFGCFA